MNIRLTTLLFIAIVIWFCACSDKSRDTVVVSTGENLDEMNESAEIVPYAEPPKNVVLPGNDNSEIVTTFDIYGNRVETRTFRNHQRVGQIVIKTLADGTKIGFAYARNGEKKALTDDRIAIALTASGDDLADPPGISIMPLESKTEVAKTGSSAPIRADGTPIEPEAKWTSRPERNVISVEESNQHTVDNELKRIREAEAERVRKLQKAVGVGSLDVASRQKPDRKLPEH